jgi:hypothetical protein
MSRRTRDPDSPIPDTPIWRYRLFWYLSYAYYQKRHPINATTSLVKAGLRRLEDLLYARAWRDLPIDAPIFIVGPHRTGTTLLQTLLSLHPRVATPTTPSDLLDSAPIVARHVFKPLLRRPTGRRVDRVPISFDSPQEAIGLLLRYLRDVPVCYDRGSAEEIYEFTRRLLYADGRSRVVFKVPHMCGHLGELGALFPDALYISLHREPADAVESKARFLQIWQEVARGRSLLYRRLVGVENDLTKSGASYFVDCANRIVNLLPCEVDPIRLADDHLDCAEKVLFSLRREAAEGRCAWVSYARLVDEPEQCLKQIWSFLGLEDATAAVLEGLARRRISLTRSPAARRGLPERDRLLVRSIVAERSIALRNPPEGWTHVA